MSSFISTMGGDLLDEEPSEQVSFRAEARQIKKYDKLFESTKF